MSQKTELSLVAVNLVNDAFNWLQINRVNNLFFNNTINNSINNNNNDSIVVTTHSSNHVLGFVALNSLSVKLNEFRAHMTEQIQSLPDNYTFLTKEGWPVSSNQEIHLNLYYIINNENSTVMIRRQFEKQRFGVHSTQGVPLGFIFAFMEDSGEDIRQSINQELNLISSEDESYQLIDRNGWPVSKRQEQVIKGWDLVLNGVLRISGINKSNDNQIQDMNDLDVTEGAQISPIRKKKRPSEASTVDINKVTEDSSHTILPLVPIIHSISEVITPNISSASDAYHPLVIPFHKPILISYVRAEAEQHARQLKSELQDLGCNVFLDVDEIEGGHDWADALNSAVLNCDLFVPLITPNYGYTQWTNREVKLADIKKKQIIPISFLDSWPPECLAIQFASTQYIPWKTASDIERSIAKGEGDRATDIKFWDQPYVRTTATAIAEHLRIANLEKEKLTTQVSQISSRSSLKRLESGQSTQILEIGNGHPSMRPSSLLVSLSVPKRRPQIVISAHPDEKHFADIIRQELSKFGFDVWCSTDMTINSFSSNSDILITPTLDCQTQQTPSQRLEECDQMSDQTLYIGSQFSESSQESSQNLTPSDTYRPHIRHKLNFSLSMSDPIAQCSQDFMSQTCVLSPEDLDKARNFRIRADAASVVIIVLSKNYCKSRICKQQAFYCDTRKMVIPIKYDDFRSPHWLSKLFDDDEMLEHNPQELDSFINHLRERTSKLVASSKDTFKCAMSEARIHSMATYVSRQLPINEKKKIMVYIAGSSKFFSPLSEAICRAIGQSLASIPFLVLVTGGVYGAAETTGRSFCEERELLLKEKPANLYHILPKYVSQDSSMKARQNPDGTFQSLPFGHTLFIGDSFKERDSVVARLFNYCIIIEGGPRTARIAEEFMWNDNIVIPIICTGGAAAGQFELPAKIHDVPLGVHQDDWSTLVRRDVTADNIAEAVKNIVYSLVKCRSRKKTKDKHNSGIRVNKTRNNKTKSKT